MQETTQDATSPEGPRKSTAAGVVAALLPLLSVGIGAALLIVRTRDSQVSPMLLGLSALVAIVLAILLFLSAGQARRIPAVVPITLAMGPWAVSLVSTLSLVSYANSVVPHAEVSQRAAIASDGAGEALSLTVAGSWLSGALLGALAVGLGIGAFARRAEGRRKLLGLLVLPLGLAAVAIPFGLYLRVGAMTAPAALAGLLALSLSAAAVGSDERSGAQAVGASFAALLAAVASAISTHESAVSAGFLAFAHADASQRAALLSDAIAGSVAGITAAFILLGIFGVGLIVVLVLALRHRRPGGAAIVAGALAVLIAAATFGADRVVEAVVRGVVEPCILSPGRALEDFTPSEGGEDRLMAQAHAVVTQTQVIAADESVSNTSSEIPALFSRLRAEHGDELSLALDARLDRASCQRLFSAAEESGHQALILVGRHQLDERQRDFAAGDPLLGELLVPVYQERVLLTSALPAGYPESDPLYWHGTVDDSESLTLSTRGDARTLTTRYDGYDDNRLGEGEPVVYLQIGPGVTPSRLMLAAKRIRHHGGRAYFLFGDPAG